MRALRILIVTLAAMGAVITGVGCTHVKYETADGFEVDMPYGSSRDGLDAMSIRAVERHGGVSHQAANGDRTLVVQPRVRGGVGASPTSGRALSRYGGEQTTRNAIAAPAPIEVVSRGTRVAGSAGPIQIPPDPRVDLLEGELQEVKGDVRAIATWAGKHAQRHADPPPPPEGK